MKIIQSFAEFDEGSLYYDSNTSENLKYLNFYSFLLSFLTLQKYYGSVTMYCNQKAYDSFIKYIPYNEIIIIENNNSFDFWSYYKVDIINQMNEKFIHVDSDVFIFDDLFSDFINNKYNVIVQDIIHKEINDEDAVSLLKHYEEFIDKNKIINPNIYDKKCISGGVIGMDLEVKNKFIELSHKIKYNYDNKLLIFNTDYIAPITEELTLYLIILKNKLNMIEMLPFDLVNKYGRETTGNIIKYTHMWFDSKFNSNYINLIKNKIIKEFPNYIDVITEYEFNVINKNNISKLKISSLPIGLKNIVKENSNYGNYY